MTAELFSLVIFDRKDINEVQVGGMCFSSFIIIDNEAIAHVPPSYPPQRGEADVRHTAVPAVSR